MPDVQSKLEFLADLDLYKTQRPFNFVPEQDFEKQIDAGEHNLNSVELQYEIVTLRDIRHEPGYKMQECGFELVANEMQNTGLNFLEESARNQYACETKEFWVKHLNAEYALCYDVKVGIPLNYYLSLDRPTAKSFVETDPMALMSLFTYCNEVA